jgi:ribosomal protein S18 acetylase RimI-like enzyme
VVQSAAFGAFEIREARRSDVAAIVALLADDPLGQVREDNSDPLAESYFRAFDEIAEQRGNLLLVAAETGGRVIGCLQLTIIAGLTRRGTKRGQIEGVRVAAGQRGRGVGERLIRHAIDMARAEGCGLVQLTTDKLRPDAHRFYEGLGFVASHLGMKLALD